MGYFEVCGVIFNVLMGLGLAFGLLYPPYCEIRDAFNKRKRDKRDSR